MHKIYLEKMDLERNKEDIIEIIDMLMCEIEDKHKELYKHIECEMYEMVYGKKLSEEMAHNWVKEMEPIGMHWTYEETTNAMHNMGYSCDALNFFVVANMMYNDYYELVKDDEALALKMAYAWLKDKDAKDDKLYNYWKHIAKRG